MQAHFKDGPWGFVLQQCIGEIDRLRAADRDARDAEWDAAIEAAAEVSVDKCDLEPLEIAAAIRELKRSKT